jgi:glycosyltransferase involved in cell wall biosynthesis
MKLICRYSDLFIANSHRTKKSFIKHGAPEEKIFVAPCVMPEDQIKKVSISKFDTEYRGKKVILSLGYLRKVKGVDYLIRAFKSLKTDDTVLIIAGTGPEEEKLKLLAKDDKNIYFVGHVGREEKSKYYSIADIFVLPTRHDPWGLVVNEAMYFGLPVITTDAAGASELINGNGFVVKAGDEEELRQAIEKLLDNDTMRKEMAHKSKEIIKDYTVKHAVEPFNEAIERAMMEKVK